MTKITGAQRHYLEHALGVAAGRKRSLWGYRNYYTADVGSENYKQCSALVELGLMRQVRIDGGLGVFRCTRDGCVAAGLSEDRIAEALR